MVSIMKKIVICDIDGTIANNDHRQHYLEGKKDWEGFFSELINDEPIFPIINKVIEEYNTGKEIVFLTGRPERYRNVTTEWLKRYFDFEIKLLMRKNKDHKNKLIIKREIFELNFNVKDIFLIFENDKELIAMWEDIGANIFDVNESDY